MIIDTHIHLNDLYENLRGATPEHLAEQLQQRGIGKAWAMTMNGFFGNCVYENDRLAALCGMKKEVFIPFMTVNPRDGQKAVEEVERGYYELGMKGLKIHNWLQAFSLTNACFRAVMEKCRQLRLPVVFHDGTPPFCTPLQVCYLAEKFTECKIILAHSGINDLWREALYGAERSPNVYLCTCSAQYIALKEMARKIGSHRIMFGSDAGFGDAAIIDDNLQKVHLLGLGGMDLDNILYHTAASVISDN